MKKPSGHTLRAATVIIPVFSGILVAAVWSTWVESGRYRCKQLLVQAVVSVDGTVGKEAPDGIPIHLSERGRPPLITDDLLVAMIPLIDCSGRDVSGLVLSGTGTAVSDEGLTAVVDQCHSSLRFLDLSGTRVTDRGVASLSRCPKLESLSIPLQAVSDISFDALRRMPQLRHVHLHGVEESDSRVRDLRNSRPDLRVHVRDGAAAED